MAKKSSVETNERRRRMVQRDAAKRAELKAQIRDPNAAAEDRFEASLKLAKLPRNGAKVRVRNRCVVSGRPRAYYRRFGMSRIALRDLASAGRIPGVVKSSW
jgi:small subunit ribosomal protein S14